MELEPVRWPSPRCNEGCGVLRWKPSAEAPKQSPELRIVGFGRTLETLRRSAKVDVEVEVQPSVPGRKCLLAFWLSMVSGMTRASLPTANVVHSSGSSTADARKKARRGGMIPRGGFSASLVFRIAII